MTPMEKLTAMRQADLVALCEKWGVKVHATKGKLKEKRLPVQERLIAAGWPDGSLEESNTSKLPFDGLVDFVNRLVVIAERGNKDVLMDIRKIITSLPDVYSNVTVGDMNGGYLVTASGDKQAVIVPFVFGLAIIYGDDECEYVELSDTKQWIEQFCAG